jgi:hypothetical protein
MRRFSGQIIFPRITQFLRANRLLLEGCPVQEFL